MSDDPLKHTPAYELDRDNRVMTREDEGERAVMESLRAENERLKAELARIRGLPRLAALDAENERLREQVKSLSDDLRLAWRREGAEIARRALENKP